MKQSLLFLYTILWLTDVVADNCKSLKQNIKQNLIDYNRDCAGMTEEEVTRCIIMKLDGIEQCFHEVNLNVVAVERYNRLVERFNCLWDKPSRSAEEWYVATERLRRDCLRLMNRR